MTDELKPVRCGCGGETEVIKHTFHGASPSYGVECTNCHAESWQFYNTEAEAIEAWNRAMGGTWQKHAQTWHAYQVGENWYCENCGQQLTPYDWEEGDHE